MNWIHPPINHGTIVLCALLFTAAAYSSKSAHQSILGAEQNSNSNTRVSGLVYVLLDAAKVDLSKDKIHMSYRGERLASHMPHIQPQPYHHPTNQAYS